MCTVCNRVWCGRISLTPQKAALTCIACIHVYPLTYHWYCSGHQWLHEIVRIKCHECRATVQIVRSWSYDVPPAVTYQSDMYPGMQAGMHDDELQQQQAAPSMPDLQHW